METKTGMEDDGQNGGGEQWRGELAAVLESVEGKPTTKQWARVAELLPEEQWERLMASVGLLSTSTDGGMAMMRKGNVK